MKINKIVEDLLWCMKEYPDGIIGATKAVAHPSSARFVARILFRSSKCVRQYSIMGADAKYVESTAQDIVSTCLKAIPRKTNDSDPS